MNDFDLIKKAWANLMDTLDDIKTKGEIAVIHIDDYDEKRRIDGKPIEGDIREYCRCGKKACADMQAGAAGHTSRFLLQTAEGSTHIPKSEVDSYRIAAEYNKKYQEMVRDMREYRETCEKIYKTLGYIGRYRTFESYLKAFV